MNEWDLIWRIGLALALSALFMLVSKSGFFDVLKPGEVILDPSRVAAPPAT